MTVNAQDLRPDSALGRYIKTKRDEARLTQDEVVAASDDAFTQQALSQWETGRAVPGARFIYALAKSIPGADVERMVSLIGASEAP